MTDEQRHGKDQRRRRRQALVEIQVPKVAAVEAQEFHKEADGRIHHKVEDEKIAAL